MKVNFSIVVLAGGQARRLGVDKALIVLKGKALIERTVERVWARAEEVLIVTKSEKRAKSIELVLEEPVKVIWDEDPRMETPLMGALTGFREAQYENILLLGCDMPLIKPEVVDLLFTSYAELAAPCDALIPQHPNGYLEPLCAIYKRDPAITGLSQCLEEKAFKMISFINSIPAVHFLPTAEIEKVDPDLETFFNVNTRDDLVKLLRILEEGERE